MATSNRCSWLIPAVVLLLLALDHAALAKPNSPPGATASIQDREPVPNESCGINMECVSRKLCRDNIVSDDGFVLIRPKIGQTSNCSRILDRCCQIKPKDADSQY